MRYSWVLLFSLLVIGCAASVGVQDNTIPHDAAQTCENQCQRIGLQMSAVALMAETVGCVCRRADSDAPSESAAASAAGMATIVLQQAQHQQQQQRQQ